jgi:dienelactone hydrolase
VYLRSMGGGPVAAIVLVVAFSAVGCAGRVSFPNATPDRPTTINARLVRPEGSGRHPAVVLLHGCHGVSDQGQRWARWLAARGYVALVVDSFGSRGLVPDCLEADDGEDLPNTARFDDAFGALLFLQAQRFVAPDRIAAMGWSQGGVFAMAVINGPSLDRARQRGVTLPTPGFVAAVGVYPGGCPSLLHERVVRPLLILIGANDDWTPAEPCRAMVRAMQVRGADVAIVVYPDAVHYFDVEGQPHEFLENVSNTSKPGGGATVGYEPRAAADAYVQVEGFLARHLRPREGAVPAPGLPPSGTR